MLIAHLPAGYCLAKLSNASGWSKRMALAGSVLPDLDLLFFYFVDHGAFHHHRYWVHVPIFWLVIACVVLPFIRKTNYYAPAIMFFCAILLHIFLDTIGGGVMWGAPFSTQLFTLVEVPTTQSHWILSFILHWSFVLEVLIWGLAGYLFWRAR